MELARNDTKFIAKRIIHYGLCTIYQWPKNVTGKGHSSVLDFPNILDQIGKATEYGLAITKIINLYKTLRIKENLIVNDNIYNFLFITHLQVTKFPFPRTVYFLYETQQTNFTTSEI